MGLETIAIAAAAVGAATTVYSTVESARAAKKQAGATKEANDINAANQRNQEADARRQQIRQQRIRQAQIEQGAANQGVVGSSGEIGSLAALSTTTAASLANMSGSQLAAGGIASANQSAANYAGKAQTWNAVGSIGSAVTGLAAPAAGSGLSKLFGQDSATGLDNQVENMFNNNPTLF